MMEEKTTNPQQETSQARDTLKKGKDVIGSITKNTFQTGAGNLVNNFNKKLTGEAITKPSLGRGIGAFGQSIRTNILGGLRHPVILFGALLGLICILTLFITLISEEKEGCVVPIHSASLGDAKENVDNFSDPEYVYSVFVGVASQRGWTKNATIGTLAYIMQEGGGMGSFTYESYFSSAGPSGEIQDKTLDNNKWLAWLESEETRNWYYSSYRQTEARTGVKLADWGIGLGLIQFSDTSDGTKNATKLIEEANSKGVYWQDLGFQLDNLMEKIENSNDTDLATVDPVKDDLTADQWARRVTAGIGMPAWVWNGSNPGLDQHARHVDRATQVYEEGGTEVSTTFSKQNCSKIDRVNTTVKGALDFEKYAKPNGDITSQEESEVIWAHIGDMREKAPNKFNGTARYNCTEFVAYCFYVTYGEDWLSGNGALMATNLIVEHSDKFVNNKGKPAAGAVMSMLNNGEELGGAGHVAFIHEVKKDGTVVISDGNVLGNGAGAGTNRVGMRIMWEVDWEEFCSKFHHIVIAAPKK